MKLMVGGCCWSSVIMLMVTMEWTAKGEFQHNQTSVSFKPHRNSSRIFPFFEIVKFQNTPCNATGGLLGICFTKQDCSSLSGAPMGGCAYNYGVCCVFSGSCGATGSSNISYFASPSASGRAMTTATASTCTYLITKTTAKICQLRLDFLKFDILGPDNGTCDNDTFTVSGSNHPPPTLCGINTGEHIYLDVTDSPWPVKLTFSLSAIAYHRQWNIRISQIARGDSCKAPMWCLQYFMPTSGTIVSFNYNAGAGDLINNQCYAICFKSSPGFCDLELTSNNFNVGDPAPVGSICMGDYISVNGIRYCGTSLPGGAIRGQSLPSM